MLFFKDDVLGFDEASKIMFPYIDAFSFCIDTGFGGLMEISRELNNIFSALSRRTCCCVINDMMIRAAEDFFSDKYPDIKIIDALGSRVALVSDKIIVRFKKLDERLHPHNHRSQQQDAVNQQLFWPEHTVVTAGYRFSQKHRIMRDKHIVCWQSDQLLWKLQLPDHPAQVVPVVTQPSCAPQSTVARKRTNIKKTGISQ